MPCHLQQVDHVSGLTHWTLGYLDENLDFQADICDWYLKSDLSHEISLRWMLLNLTDSKSTLAQVMAWLGTKPLPELMLTQMYGALWHH